MKRGPKTDGIAGILADRIRLLEEENARLRAFIHLSANPTGVSYEAASPTLRWQTVNPVSPSWRPDPKETP